METKKNTGTHTIYIGNLSYNRNEDGVLGIFKQYGFIKNIKIMREGKEDKSKGVAFVDMVNMNDALKAIKCLDGSLIDGRTVKCSMASTQGFVANDIKEDSDEPKPFQLSKKEKVGMLKIERRQDRVKKQGLQLLLNSKK